MKKNGFLSIIQNPVRLLPRFKLIKPEDWMNNPAIKDPVQKGDYYLYEPSGVMISEKGHQNITTRPARFEFVGYFLVRSNIYNQRPYVISETPIEIPDMTKDELLGIY